MFGKILSFLMFLSFLTVQTQAATHNGLKAAFDELNYALTVEWDQNDQQVYEKEMKKFMNEVRQLKNEGLTNEEMIGFVKTQIKDQKVAKDLETAFSMITINNMSTEEASKYMIDSMKRAYSQGASWTGDGIVYLAAGLLLVALAVAAAGAPVDVGGGGYRCYEDCYYYDYQCGYDWWGWPVYCEAYTCDTVCY